jgi:large subunit ribosomal protein L21|tara:strand:+ start:751 stop:1065 length:315 start_codon:yes stop_codon:yes gene_type:complete
METYAVIETGGKQYRVQQGDQLDVELISNDSGESLEFDALAVSDGSSLEIGTPIVEGAKVTVSIVEHLRGKKIYSFKKKRRKGYRRKIGHRQELTKIQVEKITT